MQDSLRKTLTDVVDLLASQRIGFAIIGGIAVSTRGEPRFTADVDAVIDGDVDRALALVACLDATRFRPLFPDVAELVERAFLLPLRHRDTGVKVDLALGLSGFEHEVVRRATPVALAERAVPVASTEDLILLKLLAARPRDIPDVRGLVERNRDGLDWEYLLRMGGDLQEAVGTSLVPAIQELRSP